MSASYEERFAGVARLYGVAGVERLRRAHVAVVGVGGVGSWVVEALARTGVGELTLIDLDEICVSNVNRQIHTLDSTVGQAKVDALAARVAGISPECRVHAVQDFFTAKTADALLAPEGGRYDLIVDAIDSARSKALLIARCVRAGQPIVVCGGAGGRVDPRQLQVDDLSRTRGDALLRRIRDLLRKEHGLPRGRKWKVPTVFSAEPPRWPGEDGEVCIKGEAGPDGAPAAAPGKGFRLDCATGYGAASFVTGAMGFMAAGLAVEALLAAPPEAPPGEA